VFFVLSLCVVCCGVRDFAFMERPLVKEVEGLTFVAQHLGPIGAYCTIIYDKESDSLAIVDPGGDADVIVASVKKLRGSKPGPIAHSMILVTHAHFDHSEALQEVKDALGVNDVACHPGDEMLYMNLRNQAVMMGFGMPMPNPPKERFNVDLKDDGDVEIGTIKMHVLHTPGHTPGSCCFLLEKQRVLISGDTLFRGSCGRTDFPGGNARAMRASLARLLSLDDDIFVIPGHEQCTTIEYEKKHNFYARM